MTTECPAKTQPPDVTVSHGLRRLVSSIWPYRLVRWALAALFIIAGAGKLTQPATFAKAIGDFGIVYPPLLPATALGLSLLELAAGLGLLFDRRGSLAAVTGLLFLFLAVLAYGLWLGLDIDCGCFVVELPWGFSRSLAFAFWRNIVLLALCGYLYTWRRTWRPR